MTSGSCQCYTTLLQASAGRTQCTFSKIVLIGDFTNQVTTVQVILVPPRPRADYAALPGGEDTILRDNQVWTRELRAADRDCQDTFSCEVKQTAQQYWLTEDVTWLGADLEGAVTVVVITRPERPSAVYKGFPQPTSCLLHHPRHRSQRSPESPA